MRRGLNHRESFALPDKEKCSAMRNLALFFTGRQTLEVCRRAHVRAISRQRQQSSVFALSHRGPFFELAAATLCTTTASPDNQVKLKRAASTIIFLRSTAAHFFFFLTSTHRSRMFIDEKLPKIEFFNHVCPSKSLQLMTPRLPYVCSSGPTTASGSWRFRELVRGAASNTSKSRRHVAKSNSQLRPVRPNLFHNQRTTRKFEHGRSFLPLSSTPRKFTEEHQRGDVVRCADP